MKPALWIRNLVLCMLILTLISFTPVGWQPAQAMLNDPNPPTAEPAPGQAAQDTPTVVAAPVQPEVITTTPAISYMVNQVTQADLEDLVNKLTGVTPVYVNDGYYNIMTRYSRTTTPIENATQYVSDYFASLGLTPSFHEYDLPGTGTRRNVAAEQPGIGSPSQIFLVVGHLDSTSESAYRMTLAPGADDNASGSVGVMLTAEVLSQFDFDCTLRYVLFTGEEQGLYGSEAYAAYIQGLGANVTGVLNLDMIAFDVANTSPGVELHTRSDSSVNAGDLAIANRFIDVVNGYGLNLAPVILQSDISASDHSSFWSYGYPAILAIHNDSYPYYHTTSDTISQLNMGYFTQFVKAAVGTAAHSGCLRQGGLAGTVTNAYTGQPVPGVTVRLADSHGITWAATTNSNGQYSINSVLAGNVSVTANPGGLYLPYSGQASVPNGTFGTHNIILQGRPQMVVGPQAFEMSMIAGQSLTATLNLTNTGYGTLNYSLLENPNVDWLSVEPLSGTIPTAGNQNIELSFTAPQELGNYLSQLVLSHDGPSMGNVTIPITLTTWCKLLTVVDFSFTPEHPAPGQVVTYTANIQNGSEPVTYTWNFGDGSPVQSGADLSQVVHTFQGAIQENYSVSLDVANPCSSLQAAHDVQPWWLSLFLPLIGG